MLDNEETIAASDVENDNTDLDAIDPEIVYELDESAATGDVDENKETEKPEEEQKDDRFLSGEVEVDGQKFKVDYLDKKSAMTGYAKNEAYIQKLKAEIEQLRTRELEYLKTFRREPERPNVEVDSEQSVEQELASNPVLKRIYDNLDGFDDDDRIKFARAHYAGIQEDRALTQRQQIESQIYAFIDKTATESPDSGLLKSDEAAIILQSGKSDHPQWNQAQQTLEFYREAARIGDPQTAFNRIFRPGYRSQEEVDQLLKSAREEGRKSAINDLLKKQARLRSGGGNNNQELERSHLTQDQEAERQQRASLTAAKRIGNLLGNS